MTVSASLHAGTVEAVRSRVGKRGFSSWTHGDFTAEEMAAARAELKA